MSNRAEVALATLASLPSKEAEGLLGHWVDDVLAGRVPVELRLDVLDAAGKRGSQELKDKVRRYDTTVRDPEDPMRNYRECLSGGQAGEGRKIFFERAEVSCLRCHKLKGEGGDAGPDLTGYGTTKTREYILESILFPNARIAQGFESVVLTLKDGNSTAGILKSETAADLELNVPEEGLVKIPTATIKTRERGPSGMPEELRQILTKRELRDLIEFLAGQ